MNFDSYDDVAVQLAVSLVNTYDPVTKRDDLDSPETLRVLLTELHLSRLREVSARDLQEVRALRGRLRAVFEADSTDAAAALLNALIAEGGALPQLRAHDDEPWHLHYEAPGATLAERLMTEAAMGLAVVVEQDGARRLRTCASDSCADVFVDASRNRSRRYCDPAVCGNRVNVAAHRARRRAAHASTEGR